MKYLKWDEILKPGTTFWVISCYQQEVKYKCPTCKGKGRVYLEGKDYECPECYGTKHKIDFEPKRWHIREHWRGDSWTLSRVEVKASRYKDMYEVMYWADCNGFPADKVFIKKTEAKKTCERLNKKLEKLSLKLTE